MIMDLGSVVYRYLDPEGPYSAFLGETTTGTCWDFAFYHSEAGYYRCQTLPLSTSSQAVECSLYVTVLWHFYIASSVSYSLERFNTGTCAYDFWGPRYALGYTRVLGSIDSILRNSSPCWEIPVSACSSWLLVVCHRLGWSRADSMGFPRIMSLGVVLNVERVPPFIVWGIVRRGSNTPSGFSTSFLPGLIGFSSDLWVLALLIEIFCPGVMDDPASRRVPLLWKGQGVVGDLGFLGLEDWSPEWSFTGKMMYLILLLGTPYLAGVFRVPRYLTTCGDYTSGPSPSPSCGVKLL
ncbi:hypothetical protein DY000_02049170 [Brassica cretica]|uniref:Uncharacterized protein n=1 Tax=Brassica cretica TaxID=69181 RepID=A0ABQ7F5H5_BRACR|nr:hypothetical protein DY000_02049170 [Brassica cretica]